jgi:hypothetical protein
VAATDYLQETQARRNKSKKDHENTKDETPKNPFRVFAFRAFVFLSFGFRASNIEFLLQRVAGALSRIYRGVPGLSKPANLSQSPIARPGHLGYHDSRKSGGPLGFFGDHDHENGKHRSLGNGSRYVHHSLRVGRFPLSGG